MKLLIPSAKIVSEELQSLGKLPAVIYPVNGEIAFKYLYRQYSEACEEITILCYENVNKVHTQLCMYKDIDIVKIPKLGDLAYTIYYGLDYDTKSVVINFGDTIVLDNIYEKGEDCFFYAEEYASNEWTYFELNNGDFEKIYDKEDPDENMKVKMNVFVGVFYLSDGALLKDCLDEAFADSDDTVSSFYKALFFYNKKKKLRAIKTDNWFDIGHVDKYYNTQIEVKSREFNHIIIDKNRGILTKYSDDKDKFIGEIKWYLKLPSDVEYMRPRIFQYSIDYDKPYVSMEYYAYHTLHELFLNGDLGINKWKKIFEKIHFICRDLKRYKIVDDGIKIALEDMYLTKTLTRLERIKNDDRFSKFFIGDIIVNGKKYCSLNNVEKILKNIIPEMLFGVSEFNIIHGDLCFTNMMVDNNYSFIKVIDPRGEFGNYDIYGDSRYELAKLFHSMDGQYDYIIKDRFDIDYSGNKIEFTIHDDCRSYDIFSIFKSVFKEEIGDRLKEIELIEAILFLSMIPLHEENYMHQLVMLGTGLSILNRVVDIEVM